MRMMASSWFAVHGLLRVSFDPPKRVGRKFFTVHRGTGFCNRKCPLNLPGNPLISMHFGRLGSASTVCTTFFRSLALGFSVPEVKPFFASQLGSGQLPSFWLVASHTRFGLTMGTGEKISLALLRSSVALFFVVSSFSALRS